MHIRKSVSRKTLAGRCGLYSLGARIENSSVLPLSLKKWLVRTALDSPLAASSMTFSNLGRMSLPACLAEKVDTFGIAFTPKPEAPCCCSLISLGNDMVLTVTSALKEDAFENSLADVLRSHGIEYSQNSIADGMMG